MSIRPLLCRGILLLTMASLSFQAAAQQSSPETNLPLLVEITEGDRLIQSFNVTVDELKTMRIYGAGGDVIGDIEEALGSPDGSVTAVSVDVGGFLGIAQKDVIIPLDRIHLQGLRLTLGFTREEIEALPEWDD